MTNEEIKKESATLIPCPFCGGKAEFHLTKSDKAPLHIHHYPDAGVNCPARFDQYCDSFEQGRSWWNQRAGIRRVGNRDFDADTYGNKDINES